MLLCIRYVTMLDLYCTQNFMDVLYVAKNEIFADRGKNSNINNCSRSSATNQPKSVLCHTTSSANLGRKNTIEAILHE